MNKFCLICTFLCVQFLTKSFAQNFREGDSLFRARQYDTSLLAYEKAYFEITEFPDSSWSSEAIQNAQNACILRKIYCLKAIGKFDQASKIALRFDLNKLPDSSQYVLRNEMIVCYFLAGSYEDVISQIEQLQFFVNDSTLKYQSDIWKIMALTHLKRYTEAKKCFEGYVLRRKLTIDVDSVFSFANKNRFKNVKKAEALATFLPGVGMMYVGNTTEGLISLGLQLGTLGFAGYSFWKGYYLSGFLTGFGLFQSFYFGGIRRTELLANMRNQYLADDNAQQITNVLMKLEQ